MFRLIACCLFFLTLPAPAHGDSDARPVDHFTLREAADFSKQVERELAERGAYIALVFRSGRPRDDLPDGVRYTHAAFWVYGPVTEFDGSQGHGYAVYNLYHGQADPTRSYLAQDWPLDFMRGDAVGEVGVIIPSEAMQIRLLDVLASDQYDNLHQPAYSLLSNPSDLRYQNCTEFMLDVIAAAAWLTDDRTRIKINLDAYFAPTLVRLGWWQRLTAGWFDPRIRLDDQASGPVEIASFTSIADFMLAFELAEESFEIQAGFGE
ncbi:DUF2145 domain-containing protein [Maricaulis maris]|uniref:DUF2145 domain-containing protein n=1 Tax=Maricaulis maris TaxID=74318 RepID=A0A495DCS9_9PROT|nr:DUF2145 domain-containing protein [Maricaulis maris]RKR00128.1 hypothetical protein C7435_1328 [Maricaulis maris]